MRAFKRGHFKCAEQEIRRAWKQGDRARRADEINLDWRWLRVPFFLGLLRCRDSLAETAGMPTVERLRDGPRERRVAGELHQH
jgi:hypothetical protein